MLVWAYPLDRRRWGARDAVRDKGERPPSDDVSYCDVGWEDGDGGLEEELYAGQAAAGDTAEGNNLAARAVVRRFPLLVRTD